MNCDASSLLIIYEATDAALNFLSHANVRLPERLDRIVRWVFVTPNMHSLHHSSHQPETDSNYGTVFTSLESRALRSCSKFESIGLTRSLLMDTPSLSGSPFGL